MTKHVLVGITYASIFGLTFMFTKIGLSHIIPVGLMAFRFTIAFAILSLLKWFKIIQVSLPSSLWRALLVLVIFQPLIGFSFEMYGVMYSQSSEAGMIIALIPVFVAILSFVFSDEKPSLKQIVFIVLSVSGVIFIQWMNVSSIEGFSILGAIFMLVSAFAAASFNIASRKLSTTLKPIQITYAMMTTGFLFFMSWYIITLTNQNALHTFFQPLRAPELWMSILYLGGVASIVGFLLVNYNLKHIPAHISSIFANIATIVSIFAGMIFLQETLFWYHLVGSLMIMVGVYGVVSSRRQKS